MTKKHILRDLDSDETRDNNKARAGVVADALRIMWARLDDIEAMVQRALRHTKGC